MKNTISGLATLTGLLFTFLLSQASAQPAAYWGMHFPTSESGPAQQHFLEGVTAMHLHMFEDAEEHFRAAQEIAPEFAMAYWGEALNNHRTIWSIHRAEQARAALNRLAPTPEARAAKAPTNREKGYLAAVEALFGTGTQAERQRAYSEAMQALSETYPDDIEAKAWYALSLMRETPPEFTRERTRSLMASLSLEVLAQNPRHPGANRYLIQSTDDPVNTDLGIIAVNNLEMLDIEAAEALHIPSHYYIQHGMWAETAESNMRAFESSMAWVDENGWQLQDLNNHNYGHLLRFANYGFLQSGQLAKAAGIRERILRDYVASGGAAEIAGPLVEAYARMVIDLERWEDVDMLLELARTHDLDQTPIWVAIGIGAAIQGNRELALEAFYLLRDRSQQMDGVSEEMIAAGQLMGLLNLNVDNESMENSLRGTVTQSDMMHFSRPVTVIGIPPRPLKPARELYGEVLLKLGRAEEALQLFQEGLTVYRGRTNLLLGAARASQTLGDTDNARRYYGQLANIWQDADSDHPFRAEVEAALADH